MSKTLALNLTKQYRRKLKYIKNRDSIVVHKDNLKYFDKLKQFGLVKIGVGTGPQESFHKVTYTGE